MQLKFSSILVKDQQHALEFYTSVLGFTKMADVPMGQFRWLTLTSPDGVEGVELVLNHAGKFQPSLVYQQSLFDAGIPALGLITTDIYADYERLKKAGVVFRGEPVSQGVIISVIFEDTCGNLINLVQPTM